MRAADNGPAVPQTSADPLDTAQQCLECQALWRWVSRKSVVDLFLFDICTLHIILEGAVA